MKKNKQKIIKKPSFSKTVLYYLLRAGVIVFLILTIGLGIFHSLFFRYWNNEYQSFKALNDSIIKDSVKYAYMSGNRTNRMSDADIDELRNRLIMEWEKYHVATSIYIDDVKFITSGKTASLTSYQNGVYEFDESNLPGFYDFCRELDTEDGYWTFGVESVRANRQRTRFMPETIVAYNFSTGESRVYNFEPDEEWELNFHADSASWNFALNPGGDIGYSDALSSSFNGGASNYNVQTKNSGMVTVNIYRTTYSASSKINSLYNKIAVISSLIIVALAVGTAFIMALIKYSNEKAIYDMFEYRRKTSAAMAHDLKTPLAVIGAFAEDLSENINTDKRKYYAEKINENVSYMNNLIKDILDFSNSQYTESEIIKENLDVNMEINKIVKSMSAALEKRGLSTEIIGNRMIETDRKMWTQSVTNLLLNASKYASKDSMITISISDKMISFTNDVDETINNVDKLLEPFVKGDSSRGEMGGSGLGLAVADNNLSRLGFKLKVESVANKFIAEING